MCRVAFLDAQQLSDSGVLFVDLSGFLAVIKHLCWQTSSGKGQAMAGACAAGGTSKATETPRGGQTEKGGKCQKEGGRTENQTRSAGQAESAFPSAPRPG